MKENSKDKKPSSHDGKRSSPLGAGGNLIIDIGNTRTKVGLFSKNKLLKKEIWENCDVKTVKEFVKNRNIQNSVLSSTTNVNQAVENYLQKKYFYIRLDHTTALPIKNQYKTPKTLGKDRLAGVVAANDFFPGKNCLVIDAGTCITYDFIDNNGNYLGGSIAPGLKMRLQAMHHFTAKLPLVYPKSVKSFIGIDTESSLQTGALMGAVMEIRGFIDSYNNSFTKINTILTGGDSGWLARNLKKPIFVKQNLILHGLNKILNHNVQLLE